VEEQAMMTVLTFVKLGEGSEPDWDEAMRQRLEAARDEPGWISGQLLMPLERLNERVIVGTWQTRADWERWHESDDFKATRQRLKQSEIAEQDTTWYETILDLAPS
jgi:heme-degrading monooxygenase HmoA